uniref:Myb-like domain-containing protein n=1 Tax=Brassica oleracea var. oleracea TaxID=109376 RepID=A0A0D3C2H6_BRAOL
MANSSGFSNLLRSQIPVDIDSPEPFWFRSQVPDESPSQVPEESGVKERRKYSPKEDKILIGAWLNTCKDPVVGNEQKAGAFWKRIVKYYNASPHLVGQIPREITSCKQRWARINERPTNLNNMFSNRNDLRDRYMHERLKNDLIENIWNKFGDED